MNSKLCIDLGAAGVAGAGGFWFSYIVYSTFGTGAKSGEIGAVWGQKRNGAVRSLLSDGCKLRI